MRQLKVLVFDIETAPMLAYVWGRRDVNIALNQIKSDWYVLAWSAKWLGDPPSKVFYRDQRYAKDIENDKGILKELWALLEEADIVITQNGRYFDSKKLNARFITHGMNPPSPYKHWDTYAVVRGVAAFTSNSLEFLTNKLCKKYKKLTHKKFPGQILWNECLKGNIKAWNEMKRYNIHDVLSTEELYMKIRAWGPKNAPGMYIAQDPSMGCKTCGKTERMIRKGFHYYAKSKTQRFKCMNCGSWVEGKKETL